MSWTRPRPWRYQDTNGHGWPGGSEVLQVAMMASSLGHAARRAADEVGTPAHDRIEAALRHGFHGTPVPPMEPSPQQDRVDQCLTCWGGWLTGMFAQAPDHAGRAQLVPTGPSTIEGAIWSSDGVAGKIDCVWSDVQGARWVLDWKTSGDPSGSLFRRLLPKYRVQVAGYLIDAEERDAEPVAGAGLVVLPSSTDNPGPAIEHLWSREDLAPEIAMQRHYRALFWLRAEQARARGDATLVGYDIASLRPRP